MGEPKAIVEEGLLKRFVPISALAENSLRQIAKKAVLAEYKPGDYLFKKNQRDGNTLYLLSGDIDLVAGGQSVHVEAGSETARHPIGQHQPRQVDAVARSAVTCIQVETNLVDMVLTWQQSSVEVGEIDQDSSGDWMTRMLQNRLFLKLPPANIQKIMMLMEDMEVSEGDTIIRQGEEGDYYYYIRSGRCQVLRQPRPGAPEVKLAELPAGESFGEEALVSEENRNATVRMLTDGVLMRLAKKDFVKLISDPLHNIVDYYKSEVLVSDGAAWLDVRLPDEYANSHISDAINIPLPTLRLQLKQLDKRRSYVIYCDTGRRSSTAAFLMSEQGFDAYVLGGGLMSLPPEVFLVSDNKEDANRAGIEMISSQIVRQGAKDAENKRVESKKEEARRSDPKKATSPPAKPTPATGKPATTAKPESTKSTTTTQDVLARAREALEQARRVKHKGQETAPPKTAAPAPASTPAKAAGSASEEQQRTTKSLQEAQASNMLLQQELQRAEEDLHRINQQLEEMLQENQRLEVALVKQQSSGKGAAEELQQRLDAERARNRVDLDALNEKLRVLESERSSARRENDETRDALEKLRQEQKAQSAEWERKLGEEIARHQRDREDLERQLNEVRRARDQAEAQAQSGQRTTDELTEKLRSERNDLEGQLRSTKERHSGELAELNDRLTEARRETEALKNDTAGQQELEQQVESLQAALTQQSAELATLDGRLADAQKQQQSTDAVRVQLEAQVKQLAGELEQGQVAAKQLEQLRSDVEALRAKAQQAENEKQTASEEKQRATELAEQAVANQKRTQEELDFTQRTVTKALMDKESAETKLAAAQDQLEQERSERERRDSELEQLRAETAELRQTRDQAVTERDAAQQARQAAEAAAEQAHNERKDRDRELKAELDRLQKEIAQYQQRLESAQSVREEAERARLEAEERANKVFSTNDQRQQELEGQIQEYQTVLARMEEELNQVGRITEEADSTRKTHEDRIQRMAQEMERLRRLVKEAESEKEDAWQSRKQAEQEVARARREAVEAIQKSNDQVRNAQTDLQRVRSEAEQEIQRRLELETNRFMSKDAVAAPQPVVAKSNFQDASSRSEREVTLGAERIRATQTVTGRHKPQEKKGSTGLILFLVLLTVGGVTAFVFKDQVMSILGMSPAPEVAPPPASAPVSPAPAQSSAKPAAPQPAGSQSAAAPKPQAKPAPVQAPAPAQEPPPARRSTETSRGDTVQDPLRGGGLAPVMVRIPAGDFVMGDDTASDTTVRPQHTVSIRAFTIGQNEITFEDYEVFTQATGRETPDDQGRGRGKHPVVNVSWNDARVYAAWLSEQTGRRYRLPTEAEWEYAARAGQKGAYWWGSAVGISNANCFNCGSQWDGLQPAPVGSFRPNPFGIYDTAGNVAEWTRDCYHASYDGAPADGSAWETGECTERVVRGGSFASSSKALRSVNRERFTLDTRLDNLGFRLVREE